MEDIPVRDAATVILVKDLATSPRVLMGQRGKSAAFMPSKFVFPGGAVDPGDPNIPLAGAIQDPCARRLDDASQPIGHALVVAAIRELWEETGLALGTPGAWPDAPPDWVDFAQAGLRPNAAALHYFFRAITPPGRPRRFDARFFLVDAQALATDADDFSRASGELSHLRWIPVSEARDVQMPFITEVVLAEVAALTQIGPPPSVPFFKNDDEDSLFLRLGGHSPLA